MSEEPSASRGVRAVCPLHGDAALSLRLSLFPRSYYQRRQVREAVLRRPPDRQGLNAHSDDMLTTT